MPKSSIIQSNNFGPANSSQQPTRGRSWPGASAPRFSATRCVALLDREGRVRLSERTLGGFANYLQLAPFSVIACYNSGIHGNLKGKGAATFNDRNGVPNRGTSRDGVPKHSY